MQPFDWKFITEINRKSLSSLQDQLYRALRNTIVDGLLRPGTRLPASRLLAKENKIARNTVLAVYDQLAAEGYLITRQGSGTFINTELPENFLDFTENITTADENDKLEEKPSLIHTGLPAIDAFPMDIWARISGSATRRLTIHELQKGDPQGYFPLREAIAEYLAASRNIQVTSSQTLIISGLQQGLKLLADSILEPDANIILEDPGYDGLYTTALHCRQALSYTATDKHGARVPKTTGKGNLLVITPSHHYPLGMTMPVSRRMELLSWANQTQSLLLEDDYDSEFRYIGKHLSSIHSLSKGSSVIYGGSFSKTLFPSLRLGYMALPIEMMEPIVKQRAATDSSPSMIPQMILAEFIQKGHFARHLRRLRKIHAERRSIYTKIFSEQLSVYFRLEPSKAGLDMVALPTKALKESRLHKEANWVQNFRKAGLSAIGLSGRYREQKARQGLLLGFACFTEKQITRKITNLAQIMLEETGF